MLMPRSTITPLARKLDRAKSPKNRRAIMARVRRGVANEVAQREAHAAFKRKLEIERARREALRYEPIN